MAEADVIIVISAEDYASGGIKKAGGIIGKALKKIKDNFAQLFVAGEKLTELGGALNNFANTLVDDFLAAEKAAFNLQNSIEATATAGGKLGSSFPVGTLADWEASLKKLSDQLKIYSDKDLKNASARMIDMTKRLGFSKDEMLKLVNVSADLGSGLTDLDSSVEKIAGAMRGEAESAEYLGLSLGETAVQTYYNASAQEKLWKDLTEAEKAQVRYNLLLDQAAGKMGRAAEYAKSLSGQIEIQKNQYEKLRVELAEKIVPIKMRMMEIINRLLEWYKDLSDGTKDLIAKFIAYGGSIATVLGGMFAVLTVIPTVVSAVIALAPVLAAVGVAWVGMSKEGGSALYDIKEKVIYWFTFIKEFLTTYVPVVLKWVRDTIEYYWEDIKAITSIIWEAIKVILVTIFAVFFLESKERAELIAKIWTNLWEKIKAYFGGINPTNNLVVNIFKAIGLAIWGYVKDLFGSLVKLFENFYYYLYDWVRDVYRVLVEGMKQAAKDAAAAVADFLGVSSPPKKGPLHTMDTWGVKYAEMILAPMDMMFRDFSASLNMLGSPVASGGVTNNYNMNLSGTVIDEQSVRNFSRMIAPELDRATKQRYRGGII